MGICLDTEQSDGSHDIEEGQANWSPNSPRQAVTPPAGTFPMHNEANVQFEAPRVPVIFVLGGPGSGKVTHCDSLMEEQKGVIHINMTDLLQQYAVGNDMQDFSLLSSKTVTEVLMLEMKMAPTAKTFLVSGYPRNMRDVVEYSEKIQVVSGVIMISWRQKVLERQIDYGAKLGQVVLSLARMELNNFYKNVVPVADYFDQSHILITINGERHPTDVYKDFRSAIFRILGMQDNPPTFANGKLTSVPIDVSGELPQMPESVISPPTRSPPEERPKTQIVTVSPTQAVKASGWPPVLWVIGGPGSNKAALCTEAARETGWAHISLGQLLRAAADDRTNVDATMIKERIANGEFVPLSIVMRLVDQYMTSNATAPGIILDGYPRDMEQATEFEAKYKQKPTIILLDCTKLQLGRGRLDDNVPAFRRRLEIFRQSSLPMLKTMDNIGRLTIVDGDTDTAPVQQDFKNVVREHIEYLKGNQPTNQEQPNGHVPNGHLPAANHVTTGKHVPNGIANHVANGVQHMANGFGPMSNGNHVPNGNLPKYATHTDEDRRREIYNEVNYMDGHI